MKLDKFKNATYQAANEQETRVEAAGANIAANVEEIPAKVQEGGTLSYLSKKVETKSIRLNLLVKESTRKRLEAMKKKHKISINDFANAAILRALDEIEK